LIKTFVACTTEVDDIDLAVEEIVSQLDLDVNMRKNAVGIITCHQESILSGAAKAISCALPFDVVGIITTPSMARGQMDNLLLTVTMLTSDDVEFAAALTSSLAENPRDAIANCYKSNVRKRPALILIYGPYMLQNSGDVYADVITEVSGGVPCFGTLAVDDTYDFSSCFMLYNGEHYTDKMAMVFIYGDVTPKFYVTNMVDRCAIDKSAVVTKSHDHIVSEINGREIDAYFEELGLKQASEAMHGLSMLPFLVDYQDGTQKVCKVFLSRTPERYAAFGGSVPEGCLLYIGSANKDDVLQTAKEAVQQILQDTDGTRGVLIHSCISRTMAIGTDTFVEMGMVNEMFADKLTYAMSYSGGEFCPTQYKDGVATNRFHNYTFIACMF